MNQCRAYQAFDAVITVIGIVILLLLPRQKPNEICFLVFFSHLRQISVME